MMVRFKQVSESQASRATGGSRAVLAERDRAIPRPERMA
ncbi:hypothetical protein C7S13_3856 [Burkholderia cepacia]|nr:hypothetical protein [Burkholderia cepacia]